MTAFWIVLAILYILGLFWIALWGDKEGPIAKKLTRHPAVYSLSLAIYCTAWTFYGAIGEATRSGWSYLPILLGPILLYTLAFPFIRKMIYVSRKQNITSIADFISSRYGKRPLTAPLVILIAVLAIIPYIALQLKAIGSNFALFVNQDDSSATLVVFIATLMVGVFAMLFGTRKVEVTEYRSGMMLAIGAESLFKLIAILAVGMVAVYSAYHADFDDIHLNFDFSVWHSDQWLTFPFIMQTLMAAAAIVCLPRQFHVTVVDHESNKQSNMARWLFPVYLLLFALIIPPIALAGQSLFGTNVNADTYVIQFALNSDNIFLQMLIFLGGMSATTAMIIIATFALSIMISNDVILPLMLASGGSTQIRPIDRRRILNIRRFAMAGILGLSFLFYKGHANNESLTGTGLLAFSLVFQLLPSVVGGLYWKKGHAYGVYAGLVTGFLCWALWMLLPSSNGIENTVIQHQSRSEQISWGALISVLANTTAYIIGSLLATERLADRIQATAFVTPRSEMEHRFFKPKSKAVNADLFVLLETFLGKRKTEEVLKTYESNYTEQLPVNAPPSRIFIDYCERVLGGVLGGSSARTLINSLLVDKQIKVEEMVTYLDETTQAIQFSQNLLFTALDSLDQGISVVDKEQRMVAWNKTYQSIYDYPDGLLKIGLPVEELIRLNAQNGECGVGEIDTLVDKRLKRLKQGSAHRFLRRRANGRVIEMVGNPLPDGGFVTSFTDVTEHIESQQALEEANIDLTKHIEDRTEQVQSINKALRQENQRRANAEAELRKAKAEAEQANASKTEFLALASHDILQPLNAAKLYMSALQSFSLPDDANGVSQQLSNALESTETLIATLLEIAKFDQGAVKPNLEVVNLADVLNPIISEFDVIAKDKAIELRHRIQGAYVNTDPVYLRRIVQNLVSNAIKYTPKGKVLISARARKDHVSIQVWDTGVGIPESQLSNVFDDFYRWDNNTESGIGLGLGLVKRMQKVLGLTIDVRSTPHHGSCFTILAPSEAPPSPTVLMDAKKKPSLISLLENCHVWCIDDDEKNLEAMKTLLTRWNCSCLCFKTPDSALDTATENAPELLLVDYQLGESLNGLELINRLREKWSCELPAVLITAVRSSALEKQCDFENVTYMPKPAKPAKLRSLIQHIHSRKTVS
ncbi:response regulator [Marinomonas mediterranea]|uniref:hybrid sensor histidine kinase/response regulator n=1 Tax=Marinomonas mediterranea TaxID=119864 RepID=UPI00234983B5|nr:PAS domain-containing hybrid sensor histidine kinase/response regulator [Marinomonas mediterranea]WCN14363.1 response regulator [Marinomonas mediterranea]